MKFKWIIAFLLLFFISSNVFAKDDGTYLNSLAKMAPPMVDPIPNSVGVAGVYSQSIYSGVDNVIRPMPMINLYWKGLFWRGFEAGYRVVQHENWNAAVVVKPYFTHFDSSLSDDLSGMDDRDLSLNAGGEVAVRLKPIVLGAYAVHDITGRTNGSAVGVKVSTALPLFQKTLIFIPTLAAVYANHNIVDYYYGVKSSEATSSRPAYSADDTVNLSAALLAIYRITDHWNARAGYVITRYGDEIADSPIVERRYSSTALLGVSYVFS
ncbi:MAG: MipA/OmpV family protein [Gammaproteobacteria bacterium]